MIIWQATKELQYKRRLLNELIHPRFSKCIGDLTKVFTGWEWLLQKVHDFVQ